MEVFNGIPQGDSPTDIAARDRYFKAAGDNPAGSDFLPLSPQRGTPEDQLRTSLLAKFGSLIASPSRRDIPANVAPDFFSGKISYQQAKSLISGSPVFNPASGPIVDYGPGPTPVKSYDAATGTIIKQDDTKVQLGGVTPTAPPPPGIQPNSYTIVKGDTIDAIASRNGLTREQLLTLNPQFRANPNLIYPGQVVSLPPKFVSGAGQIGGGAEAKTVQDHLDNVSGAGQNNNPPPRISSTISFPPAMPTNLTPAAAVPTAPSLLQTYKDLKETLGINTLEADLATAKEQKANFLNEIASQKYKAKGALVSSVVIGRNLVKIDADAADALNRLQSEEQAIIDTISNRTNTVSTMISLTNQDYTIASKNYNDQYDRNIQMFGITQTATNTARDDARANLQIMQNLFKAGNLSFDSLPQEQKNYVTDLEAKSGYPIGITKFISANVKGDVVTSSSRTDPSGNKYTDIVTRDPATGAFNTQSIYSGKEKATGADQETGVAKRWNDRVLGLSKAVNDRTITYQSAFNMLKSEFPEASDNTIAAVLAEVKQ